MNCQRIYDALIANRRINPPLDGVYAEVHHIVPRCFGGDDSAGNLIRLSPHDHFFAHVLLAKIHGGKMWAALRIMASVALGDKKVRWRRHTALSGKLRDRYARAMISSNATLVGDGHPNSDLAQYEFEHIDGTKFTGTRHELISAHGVDGKCVNNVMSGYANTAMGWFVPVLLCEIDLERLRRGRRKLPRDKTEYLFKHSNGDVFSGTRVAFRDHSGISRVMVDRLVLGECHMTNGWYLPALNPNGVEGKFHTTGERNGSAIKTKYDFKHRDGGLFTGTRMGLVERYGLSASAVHNMMKGVSRSSGGWSLIGEASNDNHARREEHSVA